MSTPTSKQTPSCVSFTSAKRNQYLPACAVCSMPLKHSSIRAHARARCRIPKPCRPLCLREPPAHGTCGLLAATQAHQWPTLPLQVRRQGVHVHTCSPRDAQRGALQGNLQGNLFAVTFPIADTLVCRYWKAGNCTHGKDCTYSHSFLASPSTEVADGQRKEGKSSNAKRHERRKRSQSRVLIASSASSIKGKAS